MKPEGIIYYSKRSSNHGEVVLLLPFITRIIYSGLRGLGAGLISLAVIAFIFSFGPVLQQEINYSLGIRTEIPIENNNALKLKEAEAQNTIKIQEEAVAWGVNSYFSLVIPKIDAKANIVVNVDINNKEEYLDALMNGIAHAKGTFFPGQSGRVFVFSHSTDSPLNFARYNAIFYLLRKLDIGDEIIVFFADKKYIYNVEEIIIANPADTTWITPKDDGEELILMTCDPPGTTWRRLLIVAKP